MRHSLWWLLLLGIVVALMYLLDTVLMPFIAGLILAYMANPLTHRFERWGMNRAFAVTSVFLVLLVVLTLSLLILVPLIVQQIKQLSDAVPAIFSWVENALAPKLQEWVGYDLSTELAGLKQVFADNWRDAGGYLAQALGQLGRSGMALISWVTYVSLIPVVTFYLLLDWRRLMDNITALIPRPWVDDARRLAGVGHVFACREWHSQVAEELGHGHGGRLRLAELGVVVGEVAIPHPSKLRHLLCCGERGRQ